MKNKLILSLIIIAAVVASRLLPHPVNFSPISALLVLTPLGPVALLGLFLSDLFLGFHSTVPFVYGSYLLIFMIGQYTAKKSLSFFALPLLSSLLFFVVTNFGVWATTSMYSKDFAGLMQSYWMGIPFFRMTFAGDMFYFLLIHSLLSVTKWKIENGQWTIPHRFSAWRS